MRPPSPRRLRPPRPEAARRQFPDGLAACDIDLDTRILTVADVYDALVSNRVYRDAWSREQAMELLRSEIGTAFDARCVDALEALLTGERVTVAARAALVPATA